MAMQQLTVAPPLAGIVRRYGFQLQPPYSSVSSVNFWPHDVRTGRQLSATRPPLTAFQTPGSNVNMLVRLNDPDPIMLAASEGTLYRFKNGWIPVTSAVTIDADKPVYAAPFLKTVIIANGGTPLIYNADGDTLAALVATTGTIPTDPRIVTTWQGCVWFAKDHILSGSRTGDATDYGFTAEDSGGAFTVTGDNEGLIGDPITALIPHTADTMVIGCKDSMWSMRGHPRRGGVLEMTSQNIGVLGQGAWCKGPGDQLFVLSKSGLCILLPQVGAIPTLISKERIPDKLMGLNFDRDNPTVSMAYDNRWNCVYICVRGAQEQAWYYDLENGGMHEMLFADYPIVMARYDELESETASGVLFGGTGYGGLARFDVQGSETVSAAPFVNIGPIRLSKTPGFKSILHEARFVLGDDMYAGSGGATFYFAETGERAAKNADNDVGSAQFTVTRNNLLSNGGVVRPMAGGHATVLKLTADTQLANEFVFEGCDLTLRAAGRSIVLKTGTPTAFPTPTSGYAWSIPMLPSASQTDWSFFVDLSRLPADWWALPQADGDDIRPSTSANVALPFDLIEFNKTNKTGFLVLKRTQSLIPQHIRIWAGSSIATAPNPSDPLGRYNAYDSGFLAFYPLGGGDDRTSNALDLTMTGSPTVGGVTGPIGNTGTNYNGSTQYGQSLGGFTDNVPITLMGWGRHDTSAADMTLIGVNFTNNGATNSLNNSSRVRTFASTNRLGAETGDNAGGFSNAITSNSHLDGQFMHFACRFTSAVQRIAVMDGNYGQSGSNTTSRTMNDIDSIIVGAVSRLTPTTEFFDGTLSLLQVHNVDRVSAYIAYQKAMQNQLAFWGGGWQFVSAAYPF